MALLRRAEQIIVNAAVHAAQILAGFFGGIALLLPNAWGLLYLTLIGAALVLIRIAFLAMIPALLKSSKVVTFVINAIMAAVALVISSIKIAIDLIETIVAAFEGNSHKFKPTKDLVFPHDIHDKDVRRVLNRIADTCPKYGSLPAIWDRVAKETMSDSVCPIIRVTYPLGPNSIFKATRSTLGWLSYDPHPYPGNNCASNAETPDWVCVGAWTTTFLVLLPPFGRPPADHPLPAAGLGAGYIVLEVLLPLLIGSVFLYAISTPLRKFLWSVFLLAEFVAAWAVRRVWSIIKFIA